MDYNKIYNEIINKRINEFPAGYYEVHHIIPVSLGGTDDEGNLVKLTAKEHFMCHFLLVAKEIICENCGVTLTAKGERKLCSLRCVRKYAANQHKVSIQDDVGNIFGSLTDAAKFHGVTVEAIRYRIKTKKYKII